ncbi:MAG: C40 family peptidase [Clostridia bacterium]|nr:C40 family peptidase [Clostridia bacterium]
MKFTKKIAAFAAISAVLFSLATAPAYAIEFPCTGYATGTNLNVRSGPDTTFAPYCKINTGDAVELLAQEGNWFKISTPLAECGYAYVSADYISMENPLLYDAIGNYGASGEYSAGQRIVKIAEQFLGLPYVYGGSTPAGFDCSGFTSYVFNQMGYTLNRISADQLNNGIPVSKSELEPGDLLLFKKQGSSRIHHVGIYVGDGMMIHSPQTGDVVKYTSVVNGYYNDCYYAARRIVQ